jgi:hypothetical protein
MAAASPTIETALTNVKTVLDAVGSLGTVVTYDHKFEVEMEYLETIQNRSTGALDLWIVDLLGADTSEPTGGEIMEFYRLRARYFNIRKNSATWGQTARQQLEAGRTAISRSATVFAASGQRQLETPETADIASFGKEEVSDFRGTQTVFMGDLRFTVEARRWA